MHSEFKDTITQRILSITKTGKEAGLFEQKYVRHDGTEIDVEAQGTAIKYRGEPAVMVMSRDITKRKNAELELVESYGELERRVEERTLSLAASEERFRTLIDLANYGILVHRNRVPIYANDALAKLYEYASPDEILALGSMRLLTHPDLQGKNYEKIMRGEILPEDYETMGVKKNGVTFWENRRSFLINWDGEKAVCSIRSDIDQRKKTEDALLGAKVEAEALSQVKTDFLANMSHELRTPLNAIIGFSEAILGKTFGFIANERQEEYIQDIHRSGNHLLQLINDILDVTAIEEGKLELQDNHIEIRILIDDISKMIQSRANSGKVTLSTQVDESVFALRGDERRLKQILLNLVSNAVKFTPDGGTVSLECQLEKAGQLKFVVADSGIGMSKEGIKTALEPFGQVDEIINGKYEGTGLGLPLTVQLVESHGGTLEIESELRKGTTVTVLIPKERVVR